MKRKEANAAAANPGATKLRGGKPIPKWKQQSMAFRASLQAANIKDTNIVQYIKYEFDLYLKDNTKPLNL